MPISFRDSPSFFQGAFSNKSQKREMGKSPSVEAFHEMAGCRLSGGQWPGSLEASSKAAKDKLYRRSNSPTSIDSFRACAIFGLGSHHPKSHIKIKATVYSSTGRPQKGHRKPDCNRKIKTGVCQHIENWAYILQKPVKQSWLVASGDKKTASSWQTFLTQGAGTKGVTTRSYSFPFSMKTHPDFCICSLQEGIS